VARSNPLNGGECEPLALRLDGSGRCPEKSRLCVSLRLLSLAFPLPPIACLPASTGIHEIKLDGFRMMVRRDPAGVRLLTRNGHDGRAAFR
jgi:ATP-dependent DNA ligase